MNFAMGPAALLIPGLRDIVRSPAGRAIFTTQQGRSQTENLQGYRPNYDEPSLTQSPGSLRLGGRNRDSSPVGIAEQQGAERESIYAALRELSGNQQRIAGQAESALSTGLSRLSGVSSQLGQAQQQGNADLAAGIQSARQLQTTSVSFAKMGVDIGRKMLSELKYQRDEIRADFGTDVYRRAGALETGIRAQAAQRYAQHISELEASGSATSPEERTAVRAMYERQAAADTAIAVGSLHENAMELRSQLETQLQSTSAAAMSAIGGQAVESLRFGLGGLQAGTELAANLRTTRATLNQNVAIARGEIERFAGQMALEGNAQLFKMASETTYPVLVFSDIMQGFFDVAWDVTAFHNATESQRLQDEIAISNPLNVAIQASINGSREDEQFRQQMALQNRIARNNLIGSAIGGGSQVAAGYVGRDQG